MLNLRTTSNSLNVSEEEIRRMLSDRHLDIKRSDWPAPDFGRNTWKSRTVAKWLSSFCKPGGAVEINGCYEENRG